MSQPSSSIVSVDNAEIKYKKALKEISKLISANRILRDSSDKNNTELKEKIDELSLRYEDLEKQYDIVRKQKQSFAQYLDEIQKQRNNLERENAYLSDCLSEETGELKKLQMHKDQKAVVNLIRTYQEKQTTMKRNRTQNEDMIAKLKDAVEGLESEIQEERNLREDYEDRYNNLSQELAKYKEMNSTLMSQNQRLLMESSHKDSYCIEKEKELDILVNEFKTQVSLLQNKKSQNPNIENARFVENFEYVLQEKNKIEAEMVRIQDAYEEALSREKEYFEIEEKMKSANMRADRAYEEVNMLRNKIVVLEAKQFLDEVGDEDYDQKEFEERLGLLLAQNDPLMSLKNGEDTSHFRIMKSFIVDLQEKIYKVGSEKKEISKKYKSMKSKFVKNAEQLKFYQGQNKLMKGKMQGYERLSEKLHFQLEKSLAQSEEEITRMTITSNNILTLKSEEYKATINVLNSQLQMTQDKADRTEKNMKQQIETLKLQLDAMRIKYKDGEETFHKESELMEIYKKKNNEMASRVAELEQELIEANQTANTFEQLFKEEKGKYQGLTAQKQHLIAQNKQLTQELDSKSYHFNENTKSKEDSYEYEVKRLKIQNTRLKEQLEYLAKQMKNMKRELEEKRQADQMEMEEIKRLSNKNSELEEKLVEAKRKMRDLSEETDNLAIKAKKYQQNYEKCNKVEQELIQKTDHINDLTRDKLVLESEIKSLQTCLNDEKRINTELQKEISANKMKNLESNHDVKKEFESKILQNKKAIQAYNQEISGLTSQLREEKSKNLRLTNDVGNLKAEKTRLEETLEQIRKKDFQTENQLGNLKLELSSAGMQIQRLKNDFKSEQANSNDLNQQIENMQQKIFSLNQQISGLKMKMETTEEEKMDLTRDLNSMKYHLSAVDGHLMKLKVSSSQSWEEQNFTSSLSDLIVKLRKVSRNYGVSFESGTSHHLDSQSSAIGTSRKDTYAMYSKYANGGDSVSNSMNSISGVKQPKNTSMDYSSSKYQTSNLMGVTPNRNLDQAFQTTESIRNMTTTFGQVPYSDSNMGTFGLAGTSFHTSSRNQSSNIQYNISNSTGMRYGSGILEA